MADVDFYLFPDALFRLGNYDDPRLAHVRPRDVDLQETNGVAMVVANDKGISILTEEGIARVPIDGFVWRIRRGTALPPGLKLRKDSSDHYLICPTYTMPLAEFRSLLPKLVLHCERLYQKTGARR